MFLFSTLYPPGNIWKLTYPIKRVLLKMMLKMMFLFPKITCLEEKTEIQLCGNFSMLGQHLLHLLNLEFFVIIPWRANLGALHSFFPSFSRYLCICCLATCACAVASGLFGQATFRRSGNSRQDRKRFRLQNVRDSYPMGSMYLWCMYHYPPPKTKRKSTRKGNDCFPTIHFRVLLMEEITTWHVEKPVNHGINYQPQLVLVF